MSIRCVSWALNEAPVEEPVQVLVLVAMSEKANDDGTSAYQSKATIARKARVSVRTAQRVMSQLESLGVIVRGDQAAADHLPPNRRPVVYDLQVALRRDDNLTAQTPESPQEQELDTTPASPQDDDGVTNDAVRGDIDDTLGVTRMAHNSSFITSPFKSSLVSEVPQQEEATEAPIPIHRPRSRKRWKPSPQAWDTAVNEYIHYLDKEDLGTIVASYELWCHEKKKEATSAGWLRWVLREEASTKEKRMAEQAAKRKRQPWHAVAE